MSGIRETPAPFMFNGMRVVTDKTLTDFIGWDFSRCRSPSRAERRFKRFGARNKLIHAIIRAKPNVYKMGDTLIMHPDIWMAMQQRIDAP